MSGHDMNFWLTAVVAGCGLAGGFIGLSEDGRGFANVLYGGGLVLLAVAVQFG